MELGLVGLPGVGKTTLFNALTGAHAGAFDESVHVGVADIPDPRLGQIASFITTRKIVPATLRLVDVPGVAPDAGDTRRLNSFLEQIRQVDAIGHVVRCFDDGTGRIDPVADVEAMDTELVLADLIVAESAHDRAVRSARSGDPETKIRVEALERVMAVLGEGRPVRALEDAPERDRPIHKSFGFVTAKPVLYIANIAESALGQDEDANATKVAAQAEATGSEAVRVCAKLEAELAELDEADRGELLVSLGLAEPALGPVARTATTVLGLSTFFTAGDKEVRAWTVRTGSTAPEGGGVIHSDIQRGFIRAECYSIDDLVEYKTEKAIREAGRLRSEGKGYELQEGDVVHYLFNV